MLQGGPQNMCFSLRGATLPDCAQGALHVRSTQLNRFGFQLQCLLLHVPLVADSHANAAMAVVVQQRAAETSLGQAAALSITVLSPHSWRLFQQPLHVQDDRFDQLPQ